MVHHIFGTPHQYTSILSHAKIKSEANLLHHITKLHEHFCVQILRIYTFMSRNNLI